MKLFDEFELELGVDQAINSVILDKASDIAEQLTILECKLNDIKCYNSAKENDVEVLSFTDEAQEIFDIHYNQYTTELYALLNTQITIITENN